MDLAPSVSSDIGKDAASTSVIMEQDFVVLQQNDGPPTDRETEPPAPRVPQPTGTAGIRRIPTPGDQSSIIPRLDMDVAICKSQISSLQADAMRTFSKLEWAQAEVRHLKEDKQTMDRALEETRNQLRELTARIESGEAALKSLGELCTFRASDFHEMISNLQQQHRENLMSSTIGSDPAPPPPRWFCTAGGCDSAGG